MKTMLLLTWIAFVVYSCKNDSQKTRIDRTDPTIVQKSLDTLGSKTFKADTAGNKPTKIGNKREVKKEIKKLLMKRQSADKSFNQA